MAEDTPNTKKSTDTSLEIVGAPKILKFTIIVLF